MTAPPLPASEPTPSATAILWADPQRAAAFQNWLAGIGAAHGLRPETVRLASADASFRRYFRIDATGSAASRIVMDAPPDKENSEPFVQVARLMAEAGVTAPQVLEWDRAHGFLLLDDLGRETMLDVIDPARPDASRPLYDQAIDALIRWQLASRPGVLPPYDRALLERELALFPEWYIGRHRGIAVEGQLKERLERSFRLIVESNLASPSVYVHRDFMPRNLMVNVAPTLGTGVSSLPPEGALAALGRPGGGSAPTLGTGVSSLPPEGALAALGRPGGGSAADLGVLDFQDAVYGPITYDIASLMRDAFLSWDEEFVLDVTIRYWEAARKAKLPVNADFGAFYRSVEWMGLQRHLKVAGIFARLTLRDGKPRYLADTPRFIAYIRSTASRYMELTPLLRVIDEIEGTSALSGFAYGRV
ncbi:aminoglycoside phosphotransferase family protein [Variovorax paradoxus]|uniref:aminoglycoside phosphotransferase family protein n=1 Tax=Variovorax paradoxus TaxID=34073 RepID=UPI00036641E6|nr:phosphotransferase [Variovorax paradoxus]